MKSFYQFLLLSILLLIATTVNAETDTGELADSSECEEKEQRFKLNFKSNGKVAEAEVSAKQGKCTEAGSLKFGCSGGGIGDGCGILAKYVDKDASSQIRSSAQINLKDLVEVEATKSDADVWSIGNTVATTTLKSFDFGDMTCKCGGAEGTSVADTTDFAECAEDLIECVHVGTKTINAALVTVKLVFVIAAAMKDIGNGYTLAPNAVKFDLHVTGYARTSDDNYLAINAEVQLKSKGGSDEAESEAAETRGSKKVRGLATLDGTGFFWAEAYATSVGGTEDKAIAAVSNREGSDKRLTFLFTDKTSADVHWDPELNLGTSAATSLTMSVAAVSMLLLVAILN